MKKLILSFTTVIAFLFTLPAAHAAVSPLSVSIVPPIQFPPSDFSVTGARVSLLWGNHRDIYGLDFGLVGNITQQDFVGLGVSGLFNYTKGSTRVLGLQLAGLTNINTNKTNIHGFQIALGANVNTAASNVTGLQVAALANYSPFTDIYGAQVGLFNKANNVYGFQIGLVNVANNLRGIQIGLVNFHSKGLFVVSPLINVGF